VTPARWAALDVLRAVRQGALADHALGRALERIPPRDRPWLQELVYGVLRLRGRLDALLDSLVRRGIASLDPDVLDTLRLGAYQLLEMGGVPPYAAVSQAVEMARAVAGKGAGALANGVLQSLNRKRERAPLIDAFPTPDQDLLGYLSSWGSHPRWLVERWVRNFGGEGARALVEANNLRPELYLRPIGLDVATAMARLEGAGFGAEPVPFAPDALRLLPPAPVRDALAAVPAVVQDPAAGLVVRYAAVPPGARVADLCSAPGGKALALAGAGARYVAAADLSFARLERVRENAARVGSLPLGVLVADARHPPVRPLDAVLIDVPCTGTGTLRRHPDGRWRLGPGDLDALAALQREILDAAALCVRPGGLLIYSTCSLEPEENEEQVDAFLDRHPEFALEPPPEGALEPALLDPAGRLAVRPQTWGVDGAFAARMRRRG
jgi:16S rRNA (cytosine967-C5)-methyltransferase